MAAPARALLGLLLSLAIAMPVAAQGQDVKAIRAKFESLSKDQVIAMGYEIDRFCITSEVEGQPGLGAMGFHAVHPALYKKDFKVDQPQILLLDGSGKVVGVEWETGDTNRPAPSMFGRAFEKSGPHPGNENDHWMLHIYFQSGGTELIATWNPGLTCPAGSLPPSPPPVPAQLPRAGEWPVPVAAAFGLGAFLLGAGLAIRRSGWLRGR